MIRALLLSAILFVALQIATFAKDGRVRRTAEVVSIVIATIILVGCVPRAGAALAQCQRHAPPWLQADCIAADRQPRR